MHSLDLVVRFFAKGDLTPDQSWQLLTWCFEHGADQFTINGMVAGAEGPQNAAFFAALGPYELAEAPRRRLWAATVDEFVRPTSLWTLKSDTIALLRRTMEDGIFDHNAGLRPNMRLKLTGPAFKGSVRLCAPQPVTQGRALAPAGARPAA